MKSKKTSRTPFKSTAKTPTGKWWVFFIWVFTFFFSALMTIMMSNVMKSADVLIAGMVLLIVIVINVLFDVIAAAVMAAELTPFNAMASNKVYGAKTAIMLIKNADKVSNLCGDVIGDICGIISGSITAYMIIKIAGTVDLSNSYEIYIQALTGGIVAAFTIGGKLLGKSAAINNSNGIIYKVAVIIQFFKRKKA